MIVGALSSGTGETNAQVRGGIRTRSVDTCPGVGFCLFLLYSPSYTPTKLPAMIAKVLLVLFYFLFPAFVIYGVGKFSLVRKIGAIVICYIAGLLLGNLRILPADIYPLQDLITTITIPLAIPLLLFSEDIRKWLGMARQTFLSLILGLVSVVIMVTAGYYIFKDIIPEAWKISGLLVGVYSGGTPNLAAIAEMLRVPSELYILTHTSDLIIGAFLLLFLITVGQRFFLLFMKPYRHEENEEVQNHTAEIVDEFESYEGIFRKETFFPLLRAFGLSILIFAIGGGLSYLFPRNDQMVVAILTITTLGIAASFVPSVNRIKKTFPLGMYFILVFSLVVASMADLSRMVGNGHSVVLLSIFLFILIAVVGSLLLHAIISKIFGINADDFIITSVALSMSPPFVPIVAGAMKNKSVVLPGLIIGIIGYAVGNYLGVFMAYLLR